MRVTLLLPFPLPGSAHLLGITPQCGRLFTMVPVLRCRISEAFTNVDHSDVNALVPHCIVHSLQLRRAAHGFSPASFPMTSCQTIAFPSFCAFKYTFHFCTSETLKIANADLRPGVGFGVICVSCVTQMCWSPMDLVSSPEFEWHQHQHHSWLPPASPAGASPVLADVPSEAAFGLNPAPLSQPHVVLGLLVLAALWLLCHLDQ